MPIVQSDSNNIPVRQFLGSGDPALNMGWLNTVHIGNLTLFGHFHAALGQKMLNDTRKNLLNGAAGGAGRNSDVMDQTGKTSETKKPTSYYVPGLLQSGLPTEAWLEDNSFVKLRSLSARFRFTEKQLGRVGLNRFGADGLTVGLEGRDLFTWTKYWGFDPEGGLIATNRVAPLNWFAYPPTRTFTASFAITF